MWWARAHRQRSPRELAAFAEAAACLGLARLAVRALPMRRLAPRLGRQMAETPRQPGRTAALGLIAWAVAAAARRMPWRCMCMEQALAARLMLRRRGIASTLYLGAGRSAGALEAHAWLRSGDMILTGADEQARFAVLASFAEP